MTDVREALLNLQPDTSFEAHVTITGLVQANYRGSVTKSDQPTIEAVPQREFEGSNPEVNPIAGLSSIYDQGVLGWIFALASTTNNPEDYHVTIEYKQDGQPIAGSTLKVSSNTDAEPLIMDLRSFLRL